MDSVVVVQIQRLGASAIVPKRESEEAACFDLYSAEEVSLAPGVVYLVSTGWAMAVPVGYELTIRPRSGLSFNNISIANSPGTCDSDYRGELKVLMRNNGPGAYMVNAGDRIAQLKVEKVYPTVFKEVEELDKTKRGSGGIGSTGR